MNLETVVNAKTPSGKACGTEAHAANNAQPASETVIRARLISNETDLQIVGLAGIFLASACILLPPRAGSSIGTGPRTLLACRPVRAITPSSRAARPTAASTGRSWTTAAAARPSVQVVTGDTGFRWYGYGSRPEFYRGPCTAFAMENLRADHNAFTIRLPDQGRELLLDEQRSVLQLRV